MFFDDPLNSFLRSKQTWVYRGFQPNNAYQLHEAFSSESTYTVDNPNIVIFKELNSKGATLCKASTMPESRPSFFKPQIKFDSFFESGNLSYAFRPAPQKTYLFLRIDTNTRGHTHWFYFSATADEDVTQQISILNMSKGTSIFAKGGKPFWSRDNIEWKPVGWATYSETNGTDRSEWFPPDYRNVNTLKFEFNFKKGHKYFFAYSPPYSYTQLISYLPLLKKQASGPIVRSLCLSESQLSIPLLEFKSTLVPAQPKAVLFIMARTHPGETCGSHMAHGIIDWLCKPSKECSRLREVVEVHIVPMVNVDGVVCGNFRTGLSGDDLNRQFAKPKRALHSIVIAIKDHIAELQQSQNKVIMCLDLHGHSTKPDVFTYGPEIGPTDPDHRLARHFAKRVEDTVPFFKFNKCSWVIPKSKKGTARAVLIREFGVKFTYTVEASTASITSQSSNTNLESFTIEKYHEVGRSLMISFCSLLDHFVPSSKKIAPLEEIIIQPDNDVEEGGSDSESEGEDLSPKEKLRFSKRIEKFISTSADINGLHIKKNYFMKKKSIPVPTKKIAEASSNKYATMRSRVVKSVEKQIPRNSSIDKSVPQKSKVNTSKKYSDNVFRKGAALSMAVDQKSKEKLGFAIRETTGRHTVGSLLKQNGKFHHKFTRQGAPVQQVSTVRPDGALAIEVGSGINLTDKAKTLAELSRCFSTQDDQGNSKKRDGMRRLVVAKSTRQEQSLAQKARDYTRKESYQELDMQDVLFSQISIRFPSKSKSEQPQYEERPLICRKVLMGNDFSRLIHSQHKKIGGRLPVVNSVFTRAKQLMRTKDT